MKALLWVLTIGTVLMASGSYSHAENVDDLIMEMGLGPKGPKKVAEAPTDVPDELDEDPFATPQPAPQASKGKKAPKEETIDGLKDSDSMLNVEAESTEIDIDVYDAIKATSDEEARRLKSEIASLERQIKNLKNGADRSKKQAMLAQKKVEMQERLQSQNKKQLAQMEVLKRKGDSQVERLKKRLSAVEERLVATRERTRATKTALTAAQKEQANLERRLKRATAQIEQENKRLKSLKEKRARVEQSNRRLKSDVSRLEKRTGRNS